MEEKYFMHRIKHASGTWDKGIEVKDTFDAAKQSYHAYFGAYAYGHDANTDYVSCKITNILGDVVPGFDETWISTAVGE